MHVTRCVQCGCPWTPELSPSSFHLPSYTEQCDSTVVPNAPPPSKQSTISYLAAFEKGVLWFSSKPWFRLDNNTFARVPPPLLVTPRVKSSGQDVPPLPGSARPLPQLSALAFVAKSVVLVLNRAT